MANIQYYDVILKPVVTEKSMELMGEKKYTFLDVRRHPARQPAHGPRRRHRQRAVADAGSRAYRRFRARAIARTRYADHAGRRESVRRAETAHCDRLPKMSSHTF